MGYVCCPEALETAPFAGKKQVVASIEVPKPQQEEPSLLHRSLLERPHTVTRASRSYLYLEDGRKVLDACGGAAVAILGHGHPEVLDAVMDQMRKVSYVHTVAYTTESAEALANWIIGSRRTGFDHGLAKAYFIGSGSEANDAAMKCARQYWFEKGETQRKFFISRQQAYHGNTIGAMSVSSLVGRKIPYQDVLLPNVAFVSPADAYHGKRAGETDESFVQRLMDELEAEILRLGPENVISFIGETVSGAALGSMPAPPGYWRAVRAMCDKYGILLHLDEIMCGAGRTGSYFAFEQEGMRPDIVTIGKGLGGGYAPIAGMLINDKIVDSLRKGTSAFNHGHTYQAHPVSCAAALAVQRVLERDHLIERVAASADGLEAALRKTFANCAYVGDIRGRGFFWTLEFVKNKETKEPFERSVNFGPKVQNTAFELGVALYPGAGTVDGVRGDHITIAPPYMASNEELKIAVSLLKKAYDIVEDDLDARTFDRP
ncbi:aminotransferase class 3 [Thozetella sp. PMI_491]|nr:aminotransferase class 3 [Thozetella sp. PMI_491]